MFTEIDFMQPTIDFIKKYPNINLIDDVDMIPLPPNISDGNGLMYSGTTRPIISQDVLGNVEISLQTNFMAFIRRRLIDKISNKKQANFIANFERWVLLQDLIGKTPKLSNFKNPDEKFWANNGSLVEIVEEGVLIPYATYQVQFHYEYKLRYTAEEIEKIIKG